MFVANVVIGGREVVAGGVLACPALEFSLLLFSSVMRTAWMEGDRTTGEEALAKCFRAVLTETLVKK